MKCLFLYNPVSGKGVIKQKLCYIENALLTRYESVEIYPTKSAEDLEEQIKKRGKSFDAVIFSGGDGTFNHVISAAEEMDIQFGYIPSGTVNDVARSLGIPRSVKGALNVILRGTSETLDCMQIGDRYAMYIAAAGAFTGVTYHTPQAQKKRFGALAYAFEAVRHNLKLDVFPVKATSCGKTVETDAVLILVMNGKSVAGFPVNRKGSMTDGCLETVIIKQVKKPNVLRRLGAYFSVASLFVFGCRIRKKDILYLHGESVEIETDEHVVWDFDGEEGFGGNAKMKVCPRAVRMFVPKNKKI